MSQREMLYNHNAKNKLIKDKRKSQQIYVANSITNKASDYLEESSEIIQVNDDIVPNIRFTILDDLEQLNEHINGKNSFQYSSCELHQEDQNQKMTMNQSGNFHSRSQNAEYPLQISESKKRIHTQGNFQQNKENQTNSKHQIKDQPFSNSRKAKVSSSNKYLQPKNGAPMSPISPLSPINGRTSNARNEKKPLGHHKNISSPIPKTMGLSSNTRNNLRQNERLQNDSNAKKYFSHKSLFDQNENNENIAKKANENCLKVGQKVSQSFMRPRMVCYTKTINLDDQVDLSIFNSEKMGSIGKTSGSYLKKDVDFDKKQHNNLFAKQVQARNVEAKNKKTPKQPQKR